VSSPLAVKQPVMPTPALESESSKKAGGEPEAPARPLALAGLSTTTELAPSDGAPAAKKKPKKKKSPKTAPAGVQGAVAAEPEPEKPALSPAQRRENLATLTPEDLAELAAEWGSGVTPEKFIVATRSNERYQFFRKLSDEERAFIADKQIINRKKPDAAAVKEHALQRRLLKLETVTTADYAHLETQWGMPRSAPQFKAALTKDASYQMFLEVPAELRKIVSATRVKKGTLLAPEEVVAARAKKAEIEAAEAEILRQEQALANDKNKLAASKAVFEAKATALRVRIAARVQDEIPDFVWEEEFDRSVVATRGKVATGAAAGKQEKQVADHWDSAIDEAKKKRDVDAAAAGFDRLYAATLNEIKTDVLADTSQSAADFTSRATAALSAQRNPSDINRWTSWLDLTMYPKYKKLAAQGGLSVHFTVAANSISLPASVTDATTAAQLLDSLFRAPSGQKMDEAHVSLETGVTNAAGAPKNPHKYWRDGATEYELYFDEGAGSTARWGADWEEADVKEALDAAMTEAYDALLARAAYVLTRAGRM
jgi:hypothetical protein